MNPSMLMLLLLLLLLLLCLSVCTRSEDIYNASLLSLVHPETMLSWARCGAVGCGGHGARFALARRCLCGSLLLLA